MGPSKLFEREKKGEFQKGQAELLGRSRSKGGKPRIATEEKDVDVQTKGELKTAPEGGKRGRLLVVSCRQEQFRQQRALGGSSVKFQDLFDAGRDLLQSKAPNSIRALNPSLEHPRQGGFGECRPHLDFQQNGLVLSRLIHWDGSYNRCKEKRKCEWGRASICQIQSPQT